jgi:hypothetical protein
MASQITSAAVSKFPLPSLAMATKEVERYNPGISCPSQHNSIQRPPVPKSTTSSTTRHYHRELVCMISRSRHEDVPTVVSHTEYASSASLIGVADTPRNDWQGNVPLASRSDLVALALAAVKLHSTFVARGTTNYEYVLLPYHRHMFLSFVPFPRRSTGRITY